MFKVEELSKREKYLNALKVYYESVRDKTCSEDIIVNIVKGLNDVVLDVYIDANMDISETCASYNVEVVSLLKKREVTLEKARTFLDNSDYIEPLNMNEYSNKINKFCNNNLDNGKLSNQDLIELFKLNTAYILNQGDATA